MPPESNVRIPLNQDFRYFHEPVSGNLSEKWAVGRNQLAEELADRIVLSRGGAFLVGGLRGVGKTTFVRLAMHAIRSGHKRYAGNVGHFELVDVWLNISRSLEPVQLLHLLIRHLYLRLKEAGLLHRLDPELQKDLSTAFLRTAFEISSSSLRGEERGRASEVGFGKAPWIGIEFLGKISSSYKRTRSDEEALKYLPYDEKAAEFDILNFARRLQEGIQPRRTFLQRLLRSFRAVPGGVPSIRVVFVLDELDKLENGAVANGASPLDPILQSLKTVFSASGFSFVFVGGKEVEERMIEDVSHADSIYESIFAYNLYLPCLWEDQGDIFGRCLAPDDSKDAASYRETVKRYLRYKGRGIPRRTWREVNKYVWWSDDGPNLILDSKSRRYMELFAKLEEGLQQDDLFNAMGRTADSVRRDRQRLYFYYTSDWVLSRGQESFSAVEVLEMAKTLNLGGLLTPPAAAKIAETTLDILRNRALIELDKDRTVAALPPVSPYYRLSPWVLRAFEGFAEEEKTVEAVPLSGSVESKDLTRIGQYQVVAEIGSGGYSKIFKVRHAVSGEMRAAKIMFAEVGTLRQALDSFEKEIAAVRCLVNPRLVQIYESGEQDGYPYFIMELLEGVTLGTLLDSVKILSIPLACRIAIDLARVLAYVHEQGFVHRDIKPTNIFLTRDGNIKLLDLGISRSLTENSAFDQRDAVVDVLGTPGYIAPEQMWQPNAIDLRSDIYSLGITLFETLAGQPPFPHPDSIFDWAGLTEEAPSLLTFSSSVPEPLAHAVARALAKRPEDRFQTMEQFRESIVLFAAESHQLIIEAILSISSSSISAREKTLAVPIPLRPVVVPPVSTLLPPNSAPGAVPSDEARVLWAMIWNGNRADQEDGFNKLCELTDSYRLLFDFARKICLWGGPGAISRSIKLRNPRLILGRSASEVDLPLEDSSVSRQHLVFFVSYEESGVVAAEDLSSHAGTRLNGERLARKELKNGDTLVVGSCGISVHVLPSDRTLNSL